MRQYAAEIRLVDQRTATIENDFDMNAQNDDLIIAWMPRQTRATNRLRLRTKAHRLEAAQFSSIGSQRQAGRRAARRGGDQDDFYDVGDQGKRRRRSRAP